MKYSLLCTVIALFLVTCVDAQGNGLGTLGLGLDSSHLSTGGIVFPSGDGSGPQATSLAAAIYGVAVPPGFDQFSSSDNFYAGANINPYASLSVTNGAQPSELLTLGPGLYGSGGGSGQPSHSPFITDFSAYFSNGLTGPNNDLSSAASAIDPIAAKFGVVIPNDNHGALFHPSLSGSSSSPGTSRTGIVLPDETNEFLGASPIQTSLHFKLPTQVSLSEFSSHNEYSIDSFKGNSIISNSGLGPLNFNTIGEIPGTSTTERFKGSDIQPPLGDNNQANVLITSAFKFSDEQLSKTEELNKSIKNFRDAMGKFHSPHSTFDSPRGSIEVEDFHNKEDHHSHGPPLPTPKKSEEPKPLKPVTPKPETPVTTAAPSPYAFRGSINRDRLSQAATTTSEVLSREPVLPIPEALTAASTTEPIETSTKRINHRNPYGFILSPGYVNVVVPPE